MNVVRPAIMERCLQLSFEILNWLLAFEARDVIQEKEAKRDNLITMELNANIKLKYHSCVNKHYALVGLSNQAFRLLKQPAVELRRIDQLIKTTKAKRNKFRKRGDFIKSDQLTALIKSLSGIYFELRKNRNDCLVKAVSLTRTSQN